MTEQVRRTPCRTLFPHFQGLGSLFILRWRYALASNCHLARPNSCLNSKYGRACCVDQGSDLICTGREWCQCCIS
ncbi:hypothetical protein EDB84DRAFT_1535499 [Lactarius hengduanensis]|nr:hypothetical protein EDB84DRAFT_1535499 [Lactarius hengduanensis]